jgi:Protein of unknown function (DUF2950)
MNTRPATVARVAFAMGALLMAAYAPLAVAGKSEQPTYPSAEEASHALFLAARNHDERTVTEILQAGDLPVSADEELEDRLDRERFVQKYEEMHRFVRQANGSMILYIGAENWPFPIPLVSRNGAWRFDSDVGAHEIRYRRIGENELTAIALCQALVAQSHPGADGATDGPAAGVLAAAKNGGRPVAFHGYYFRTLAGSGNRVAALAYPIAYRSSGVMTFAVDAGGTAYEKDLGPSTAKIAGTMTGYRIDRTWSPAEAKN